MAVKFHPESEDLPVNHEINVTPFIDVMLVLLIIFMVVAPLATVDVPVDLPVSSAGPAPDVEPVFVTLQADHGVSIGDTLLKNADVGAALDAATKGKKDTRIFLRADKRVDYGDVMGLMDQLRKAGYLKVALVGLDAADAAAP
ncbi:MAG: TonB system transport protein ExbD [Rhizomicrobium sp.]